MKDQSQKDDAAWRTDAPDWQDEGRVVEMIMPDGACLCGRLRITDHIFTGEEEVPVFSAISSKGPLDFLGADRWRFTE